MADALVAVFKSGSVDTDIRKIVAKDGTEIIGLTKHGVDRLVGDGGKRAGTRPEVVLDALKNPTKIKDGVDGQGRPFKIYQGTGWGFTVSASAGKGNAEGESLTHSNTHIRAGERVLIESGDDTVLAGAVVSAERVEADIGGDLLIESLQDRATYREKSKQTSASATFGAGVAGGSFSSSNTNIESEYASVGEQSAIRAGDAGFDIKVKGKTVLKGGAITSTQLAVDEQRNGFASDGGLELEDVHNEARYKAKSRSAGASVYVSDKKNGDGTTALGPDGQPVQDVSRPSGVGLGDDKGDASSTTRASISGIAGHQDARTGDAETGLVPIFDKERASEEVNAQTVITRNGMPMLTKGWGDAADQQRDELRKEAEQLDAGDPARAQLLAEADRWDEGGVYRAAGHVVIGGVAGGAGGALGAGGASLAAPGLNDVQHQLQTALQDAGVNAEVAKGVAGLGMAGGLAAITGAAGGGAAGAGAAFNTDLNNRQLHPTEKQRIRELADGKARASCRGDSACERDARLYWSDMLERVAESRVDAQAAAEEQAYRQSVIDAANRAGTEASMGGAERYFADMGEAQRMLDAAAGRPILDSQGRVVLGSDGQPQTTFSATQAQRDDPYGNVFPGGSPGNQASVVPGKERRDAQRLDWLNTPNGQAVPDTTLEEALLGVRLPAKGAKAVVQTSERAGGTAVPGTAKAVEDALLRSGGAFDDAGNPLLDMSQLSNQQKGAAGELFGEHTVRQIVPDGQKIARMPAVGESGIDDLYKVDRPDVDYVVIEYKFVGSDGKTGAQALGKTGDGVQGSQGWIGGSGRVEKAVQDEEQAASVRDAIKLNRIESWVITTRPDGSTSVQILDAVGKPKSIDASKILLPNMNLSGARP